MEVAAIAGLLAMGYALTKGNQPTVVEEEHEETTENFESTAAMADQPWYGGQPPPMFEQDRTPAGEPTVPGLPRQPRPTASGELDMYYTLPSGGSLPSNPMTQADLFPRNIVFASPAGPQAPPSTVTPQVRMNGPNVESPPVYNSGRTVISPLSGIAIPSQEFTHNNMTPFYRGSLKQNMGDMSNRGILDSHIGTGSTQIGKREQAPLFDPHREPTGNITGMESITSFLQDRVVAPTSRANEVPVEPMRVGPGLNQGYSSLPMGGFQQYEAQDIAKQRLSVDELRSAANPKITYDGVVVPGKSLALQRGELGETRKYRPDMFHLNENGERNFTTVGDVIKPMERPAQVVKFQTREETTGEVMGPAGSADFKATYNIPSYRAPMVRQHEGFGMRNADGSTYGVSNTDAPNNDFGRAGIELPVNQRNVTSERGQALNLTAAGAPKAMTVYDPKDVARTTVRETTGANNRVGIAGPGSAAQKLTVYDPTDITRITARNTNAEPDRALNVSRAGIPGAPTVQFPDGVRGTAKETISANSEHMGPAGAVSAKADQVYDFAYAMRSNPTREVIAAGRTPIAGNGGLALFNGEDYMNMTSKALYTDVLNDRVMASDRVVGPPSGTEVVGLQRSKQTLQMDISRDRNLDAILDSLSDNPYAMPLHKIAAGGPGSGPAALAALTIDGSGY